MTKIDNLEKYKTIVSIGDAHAKFDELKRLLGDPEKLYIQLGDLGVGFPKSHCPEDFGDNFKFIVGNHDNPSVCKTHKNFLGNYGYIEELDLFYTGGAWSIDWQHRTPDVTWWSAEEMSPTELSNMVEFYEECKPRTVISHDCPLTLYGETMLNKGYIINSRTALALDRCLNVHRPELWLFGHHHESKSKVVKGTSFRLLNELETFEMVKNGS